MVEHLTENQGVPSSNLGLGTNPMAKTTRPFRFAVQAHHASSANQWRDFCREVEAMGYSALYVPDHFSDLPGP